MREYIRIREDDGKMSVIVQGYADGVPATSFLCNDVVFYKGDTSICLYASDDETLKKSISEEDLRICELLLQKAYTKASDLIMELKKEKTNEKASEEKA